MKETEHTGRVVDTVSSKYLLTYVLILTVDTRNQADPIVQPSNDCAGVVTPITASDPNSFTPCPLTRTQLPARPHLASVACTWRL